MSTINRKQRERQERESRILDVARPMLLRDGYHGLKMDDIARELEYSKGTIYGHFPCKEEVILALAIETTRRRTRLFTRAAAFEGKPREKLLAIGYAAELFFRLYPEHFTLEQLVRSAAIWDKASEERQQVMGICETECVGIVGGIIREGIEKGDLTLPEGVIPEAVVLGLWSMSYGSFSIIATSSSLAEIGIRDPYAVVRRNLHAILDGYGWKPLSIEHDYQAVLARVQKEIFPDEHKKIQ